MSSDDFQIIDETILHKSIFERDSNKIYHQQGIIINDSRKSIHFISGENSNYYQIGNAYLQFELTLREYVVFLRMIIEI